jgi:hypothetical protein
LRTSRLFGVLIDSETPRIIGVLHFDTDLILWDFDAISFRDIIHHENFSQSL